MRQLEPNLYMEAFGIVFRKYENEDCRKTMESIRSRRPEKELITEIFQPMIEMMEVCEDLSLNPENPLYGRCSALETLDDGSNLLGELFFAYYRTEESEKPSDVIPQGFAEDHGQRFVECIFSMEDKLQEDPVLTVLHSEWKDQDKILILKLLVDGEVWIREFCSLLEQIAERIRPVVEKYQYQYDYLDRLMAQEDSEKKIFLRMRINPLKNVAILPVMSLCNMGFMRAAEKEADSFLIIHMGTLHCVIDFSESEEFSREQLLEHLKCLSDATKVSILTILKESPTYQTDLARRLGLTTATISHHMNQLVHNGFVKHRLEEKKVYYEYQPDMVEITCAQLEKLLGNASVTENPPSGL